MKSIIGKGWLLPVSLFLVLLFLLLIGGQSYNLAGVETQFQAVSGDHIIVIPLQLERDNYGLAMVDTLRETLWIYEINNRGPAHNRLRLLAARSWKYDRLLEEYNTAEPRPKQVKLLLEKLMQPETENIESNPKELDSESNRK
ncbi:MAG: hypothetical protein ACYSSP_10460 [Planctomycetota bacterium]|jgi:hypothetical protein